MFAIKKLNKMNIYNNIIINKKANKKSFALLIDPDKQNKNQLIAIIEKANEEKEPEPVKIDPKYIGKKMSRNEPCFCGSGKKYKRCCGAL